MAASINSEIAISISNVPMSTSICADNTISTQSTATNTLDSTASIQSFQIDGSSHSSIEETSKKVIKKQNQMESSIDIRSSLPVFENPVSSYYSMAAELKQNIVPRRRINLHLFLSLFIVKIYFYKKMEEEGIERKSGTKLSDQINGIIELTKKWHNLFKWNHLIHKLKLSNLYIWIMKRLSI
jgi:hypothetical protein